MKKTVALLLVFLMLSSSLFSCTFVLKEGVTMPGMKPAGDSNDIYVQETWDPNLGNRPNEDGFQTEYAWDEYQTQYVPETEVPLFPETEEHVHVYNEMWKTYEALMTPATCTSPAVYYMTCACGEISPYREYTFQGGEYAGHTYTENTTLAAMVYPGTYYYSCYCGAIDYSNQFSIGMRQSYVKDGLVAWYDATNNSNGTQNVKADLWKDLSGNANHIDMSEAASKGQIEWYSNALFIRDGGCYLRLPEAVVQALEGGAYTIEIVTGSLNYSATDYITLLSSANDELSLFIRCSGEYAEGQPNQFKLEYKNQDANGDSNRPYMYDAWNYFNGKTLAITSDLYKFDGFRDMDSNPDQWGNVHMYSDGMMVARGESEYNMDLDEVYLGHTGETRSWAGEIYAIRVYNRALSEEEISMNANADMANYRWGNYFVPVEEYDPVLDQNYVDFKPLDPVYTNDRIVINRDTDLIPLTGFYKSTNLLDYLYPYYEYGESWEGARLMRTEELETDQDGNTISDVGFSILYDAFCTRASLTPTTGRETQYIVLKMIANGGFDDFNARIVAHDADPNSQVEFSTSPLYGGIDRDKEGEVQYLIFDVEGIFDNCEYLDKMYFNIANMGADCQIYLLEIAICSSEQEALTYAGEGIE